MNPEERVADTMQELREVIREGHELLRDLRVMKKEMDKYNGDAMASVDVLINASVKGGLERFERAVKRATEDATQRTFAKFDEIMAIMLGKDQTGDDELSKAARRYRVMTEMATDPEGIPPALRRKRHSK